MGLLSRFRDTLSLLRAALFSQGGTAAQDAAGLLSGILGWRRAPERGTQGLLEAYKRLPFVHSLFRRIAEDVSSVPWQVYAPASKRRGKHWYRTLASIPERHRQLEVRRAVAAGELRPVEEHPILTLFSTMNPYLGGFDSWVMNQLHLELVGDGPFVRQNNPMGNALQLWPIPPSWVMELPSPAAPFYRVQYMAWNREIPEQEMFWLRVPDPLNPYVRGTSYGAACADEIDTDELRTRYAKNFFNNDATPAALVQLGANANTSQAETDRFRDMLNERHRGPGRNGIALVTNREVKYQQLQPPMRELQFAELHPAGRNLLLEVLQFPRELVGLRDGSNRATIGTAEYLYYRGVVLPRLERRRSFGQQLLAEWDERLILGYANPVPEDTEAQREYMQQVPTAFTLNEHRAQGGKPPLEGEEGEALYTPPAPAAPPLTFSAGREDPPSAERQALPRLPGPGGRLQDPRLPSTPRALDFTPCNHRALEGWETCDAAPVVCVECRKSLGCHFEPTPLLCATCRAVRGGRKEMRPPAKALLLRSTGTALEALRPEQLSDAVLPVGEELMLDFGQEALTGLGVDASFNMRNPLVRQRLEAFAGEHIRLITATTLEALREELAAGVAAGEGISELKKRVEDVFDAAEGYRAERIARTEVVGLSNGANLEAYRQSGVVEGKEWVSTRRTEYSREGHQQMDGTVVGLDEAFTNPETGAKAMHPGAFGLPDEDIQCFPGDTRMESPTGLDRVFRRLYSGQMIEVETVDGHRLTGTPNHPVLTLRGWKALGALDETDHLVSGPIGDVSGAPRNDVDGVPPVASEVFDLALIRGAGHRVEGGVDQQFHGDGSAGDVDVVGSDRELENRLLPALLKGSGKLTLTASDLAERALTGERSGMQLSLAPVPSTNRSMGGIGESEPLLLGQPRHADAVGLAAVSERDASGAEGGPKSVPREAEPLRHGESALPGGIRANRISRLRRVEFTGHVYNLQAPGGWYLANGIVAHNCRCVVAPKVTDPKAARAPVARMTEEERAVLWKAYDADAQAWEEKLLKAFQAGFRSQREAVLAAL